MSTTLIAIALVALAGLAIAALYNRLLALRNTASNAYAQIDVQLKRRHDLVPNLVETARGYMAHERATLENVTAARTAAQNAAVAARKAPVDGPAVAAVAQAETALSGALGRLFAVVESYPELKADETMTQLAEEIASTENRIAFSRQAFNDAVMELNTAIASFPTVLFSALLGFRPAESLRATAGEHERQVPKIAF